MVEIDVEDYDGVKLGIWTVADLSAVFWGLSAAGIWDVRSALGSSSELLLMGVGLVGLSSLIMTWTNAGAEPR